MFFGSRRILSVQNKIFKKGFCELIEKQAVLILINSRDSGAAHIFQMSLYWSNIQHSNQALILHKLLYYNFVSSRFILRCILKFISVDLRIRIEYKELSPRKNFQHTIHVVRYNFCRALNNFGFLLCWLEFQIIIFQIIFLGLDASLDIIDKMIELCKNYCGEDSYPLKLWDQFFEMQDLGETTRCQVNQNDWYQFFDLFFNITCNVKSQNSIINPWNVNQTDTIIDYAELVLKSRLLLGYDFKLIEMP